MMKLIVRCLYVITIGVFLFLILSSCNPQKQLAKAENKVLANPQSIDKIGRVWESKNPCTNDTIFSTDTIKKEVPKTLPPVLISYEVLKYKNFKIDTTINGLSFLFDTTGLRVTGVYLCEEKTINTKASVTDNRRLGLARDSIDMYADSASYWRSKWAMAEANFEAAKDSITDLHKQHQQNLKSVTTTGKWFINAVWDSLKWLLLLAAILFILYKFRGGVIGLFTKMFKG